MLSLERIRVFDGCSPRGEKCVCEENVECFIVEKNGGRICKVVEEI